MASAVFTGGAAGYCPLVLTNLFGCYQRQRDYLYLKFEKSQALNEAEDVNVLFLIKDVGRVNTSVVPKH